MVVEQKLFRAPAVLDRPRLAAPVLVLAAVARALCGLALLAASRAFGRGLPQQV
jgi:hypothetical protein